MSSVLWFLLASAGIVAFGWVVSRVSGARSHLLPEWAYAPGERVVWRDGRADVLIAPRWGGAVWMRPWRLGRWAVVATSAGRVLLACRSLTGKQVVLYVLTAGPAADGLTARLDGGWLRRGYKTVAIRPGEAELRDAERPRRAHAVLWPVAAEASSFNIAEVRVYSEDAAGLRAVVVGGGGPAVEGAAARVRPGRAATGVADCAALLATTGEERRRIARRSTRPTLAMGDDNLTNRSKCDIC